MQEALQRIVYRLCALASASRDHLISGEPQQNVDLMEKILALGLQDSMHPIVIPQNSQHSQHSHLTFTTAHEYERYVMAPFLWKMYELLKAAQVLKFMDQKPGK
jgi:hypothetical protein